MTRDKLVERIARAGRLKIAKDNIRAIGAAVPCDEYLLEKIKLGPDDLAYAAEVIEIIQSAGLCIVPREPTEGMMDAGQSKQPVHVGWLPAKSPVPAGMTPDYMTPADDVWRAMIAAAGEG